MSNDSGGDDAPRTDDTALLTENQAAEYLGIKVRHLRRLRADPGADSPPHVRISERITNYRRADLDLWIEQRRTPIDERAADRRRTDRRADDESSVA